MFEQVGMFIDHVTRDHDGRKSSEASISCSS